MSYISVVHCSLTSDMCLLCSCAVYLWQRLSRESLQHGSVVCSGYREQLGTIVSLLSELGPEDVIGYVLKCEVIAGGYIFSDVLYFKQETVICESAAHYWKM